MTDKTVVVTISDKGYSNRAERTIKDIRGRGEWTGDIVFITVDFVPSIDFINKYNVTIFPVKHIDLHLLKDAWRKFPIKPMADERHTKKLAQWNKLYVFDKYFKEWNRVVFFDAGLRVVGPLKPLLDLDYKGKLLAPDDCCPGDNGNRFVVQMDWSANPQVTENILKRFGREIVGAHYFLNCMWVYDTDILDICNMLDLEDGMNQYPISLCNEMGIMNLYFTYLHALWRPLPEKTPDGKWLFAWCELNYPGRPDWTNFHFIKYPVTVPVDTD